MKNLMRFLKPDGRQASWWIVVLPAVVGIGMYFMYTRFSAFLSGDAYTYVNYARLLAAGKVVIDGPIRELLDPYIKELVGAITPIWNTALLPDGRWVYTVAPGYPLFLAAMYRIGGQVLMVHANLVLQATTLILFSLLIFQALRRERWAGWVTVTGVLFFLSLNIGTQHQFVHLWREPWIFTLLLGAAAAFAQVERYPRLYWLIPLLLGMACAVKESCILYAGWMGIALLLHPVFRARPQMKRDILLGALLFAVGCSPLLLQNWYLTGRPWTSLYVLRETSQFSLTDTGAGLSAGNMFTTLQRYLDLYRPLKHLMIPYFLLAAWGWLRYRSAPITLLMLGWFILHLVLHLQWRNADFRHMYFINFPLTFLAALGVHALLNALSTRITRIDLRALGYPALAAGMLVVIIGNQPLAAAYGFAMRKQMAAEIVEHVDPEGIILANRPLRDVLGTYSDLHVIRFHELLSALGLEPATLTREMLQAETPVYFTDAPDGDPQRFMRRIDMGVMDWRYLNQGSDLHPVQHFEQGTGVARLHNNTPFTLYRLKPWTNSVVEKQFEIPPAGAAFLHMNPKGLEEDLVIELDGVASGHDFDNGAFIPLPDTGPALHVRAYRSSGKVVPRDFEWQLVDWDSSIILRAGSEAEPLDTTLFRNIPPHQPRPNRRRFEKSIAMRVPVREGTDVFELVQVETWGEALKDTEVRVEIEPDRSLVVPCRDNSIWIPVEPLAEKARTATYRDIRVLLPDEEDVYVTRVVVRPAWRKRVIEAAEKDAVGTIVTGVLAPMTTVKQWRYWEGGHAEETGHADSFDPRENPFFTFLSGPDEDVTLRWEDAGLVNTRIRPMGRVFRVSPLEEMARHLISGFHSGETGPRGGYRWTAPNGRIRLPVLDTEGTHQLRLKLASFGEYKSNRVDVALADDVRTAWINPDAQTYEWNFTNIVETGGWTEVEINAPPWSPAEFGSPDDRVLGVQWFGAEWELLKEAD